MHVFWAWSKTRMMNAIFTICSCYCEASCLNPGQTRLASDELDFNSWVLIEVSNVFVWYKANDSVCWLSCELNLFMNVFVTFVIRSWLFSCWFVIYCHWLHSVILKSSYEGLLYIWLYILESKKSQLESKGVLVLKYAQSWFVKWMCLCLDIWISIRIRVWVRLWTDYYEGIAFFY